MSSGRYKTIVANFAITGLAAAALYGCAGNGNGLDANGNPITPGSGSGGGLTADFQSIQDNVFTPICTRCHQGASAPQGLQLDAAHSYAMLVGVPSSEQPSVLRVEQGDPDSSYIIRKLQNTPGITGQQMPFGGPYLPQSTIDVIRQWITSGAPKPAAAQSIEAAVKSVQQFAVATTSPDNDSIVSADVPQIIVEFNGDIDSTLINNATVTLDTAAGDQASDPVLVTTSVPKGNAAAILIKPRAPLTNGTYRVTLHGSLANMNAQALGSDVSFTFTVDALQ
ncbi:MAG TPA: Ig-like domain-containing protein [Steroidobacteraceae bacterium]|nr:Ig-like domain-containing protein [Steroidobacteraceae bacterium]